MWLIYEQSTNHKANKKYIQYRSPTDDVDSKTTDTISWDIVEWHVVVYTSVMRWDTTHGLFYEQKQAKTTLIYSMDTWLHSHDYWHVIISPILTGVHYSNVKLGTMTSQITSITIVYSTVFQAQINKNIKALRHWPLRGQFTGELRLFCHRIDNMPTLVRVMVWCLSDDKSLSEPKMAYSISQEICTRFLLCCALLWLYIDWFSHIHQAYFTGTVAI